VMTAQPPLPLAPGDAHPIGMAAAIAEDSDGGRVFVHGNLVYAQCREVKGVTVESSATRGASGSIAVK